jgi:hypothetical protein
VREIKNAIFVYFLTALFHNLIREGGAGVIYEIYYGTIKQHSKDNNPIYLQATILYSKSKFLNKR